MLLLGPFEAPGGPGAGGSPKCPEKGDFGKTPKKGQKEGYFAPYWAEARKGYIREFWGLKETTCCLIP